MNDEISFRNLAVLDGGKYLNRNFSASEFHVVMELAGREMSHSLARSLRENGKRRSRMASSETPFILNVSQISKKPDI